MRLMHGIRIDIACDRLRHIDFARQHQGEGAKGRIELVVAGGARELLGKARIEARLLAGADRLARVAQHGERDLLRRLPAVEGIRIAPDEEQPVLGREVGADMDRRRELAEDRGNSRRLHAFKDDFSAAGREVQHAIAHRCAGGARKTHVLPVGPDQPEGDRDMHWLLRHPVRRFRQILPEIERQPLALRIVAVRERDRGSAGLVVPERELRQVRAGRVREAGEKILDRRCVAVMALEVEVHAGAKAVATEHGLQHAADLGAFLVDGRRIEIVDLTVAGRPYRVRERACILGELLLPQAHDVGDALHRARAHVGRRTPGRGKP